MIINADDFGLSSAVNAAILESFRQGWCSSTTLMANMPGTLEACQIAHDDGLIDHVGLHLVLDSGLPLSEAIRGCPRFCDASGQLAFRRRPRTLRLDVSEKRALADEIRAQIARCRAQGIPLTHLDSHHHVHTEWGVLSVVIQVAREQRIPNVRLSRNVGPDMSLAKRLIKAMLNARLRRAGLARTRYFSGIDDCLWLLGQAGKAGAAASYEVLVHPVWGENDEILNGEGGPPLGASVSRVPGACFAESFNGRRYEQLRSQQPR